MDDNDLYTFAALAKVALTAEEETSLQRLLEKKKKEKRDKNRKSQVEEFKAKIGKSTPHIKGYLKKVSKVLQEISKDARDLYGDDPMMRMLILAGVNATLTEGTAAIVEGRIPSPNTWAKEAYQKAFEILKKQKAEKPKTYDPWDTEQSKAKDLDEGEMSSFNKAAYLVDDLQKAGFLSVADRLEDIRRHTDIPNHTRLVKAVHMLKARGAYATAERLDEARTILFGALTPDQNKVENLRSSVEETIKQYSGQDELDADLIDTVVDVIREGVNPIDGTEDTEDDQEEDEKQGLGPGFEPPYVKAPQTVNFNTDPLPPTPQKEEV